MGLCWTHRLARVLLRELFITRAHAISTEQHRQSIVYLCEIFTLVSQLRLWLTTHMARRGPKPPQMRIIIMTKQVNYGLHETLENSHRTLSSAVEMYAIYYSDWSEILEELSQYYASDEWQNSGYGQDLPEHVKLMKRRNYIIREMQEIGKELRAVGIDVDLCINSRPDEYFDQFEYAA